MTVKNKQSDQGGESMVGFLALRFLLLLIYYVVLVPTAWFTKKLGCSWMPLAIDPTQDSYWNKRDRKPTSKSRFEKQS